MPASFAEEALKAQAVAARTYTLYKLISGGNHGRHGRHLHGLDLLSGLYFSGGRPQQLGERRMRWKKRSAQR